MIDNRYGERIDHLNNHLHQIFTFVFITGKAFAPDKMQTRIVDHVLASPPAAWPNILFAMDQYLVTFCCDSGICPNPMDARGVALQRARPDEEILMRFYLLLGQAIEVTRVSSLPYWEYLHSAKSWNATVWYSCADDPPPYLTAITTA